MIKTNDGRLSVNMVTSASSVFIYDRIEAGYLAIKHRRIRELEGNYIKYNMFKDIMGESPIVIESDNVPSYAKSKQLKELLGNKELSLKAKYMEYELRVNEFQFEDDDIIYKILNEYEKLEYNMIMSI